MLAATFERDRENCGLDSARKIWSFLGGPGFSPAKTKFVAFGFRGCGKNRQFGNWNERCTSKTTCADQTKSKAKYLVTFHWKIEFPAIIRCGGFGRWWIAGFGRCGVILMRCTRGADGRRSRRSACCGHCCCKRCTRFAARRT